MFLPSFAGELTPFSSQDPASVQALLDKLRAPSTACQPSTDEQPTSQDAMPHAERPDSSDHSGSSSSSSGSISTKNEDVPAVSVAALLSQLQASSGAALPASALTSRHHTHHTHYHLQETYQLQSPPPSRPAHAERPPQRDLRACTFQQALPLLSHLAEDKHFLEIIRSVSTTWLPGFSYRHDSHSVLLVAQD